MKEEKTRKPKKVEEKKEEVVKKVEKKDYSIEEKSQKRLKGLSKAMYIITKIIRIFLIIGIVGIGLAMIGIPIITGNIKTEPYNEVGLIKVFDKEVEYTRTDEKIAIYEKSNPDNKTIFRDEKAVEGLNKVFEYLEGNDLSKVTLIIEFELAVAVVLTVISVVIAKKIYLFFKNIHEKDSPFILENIDLIKSTIKFMWISFAIALSFDIINSIILNVNSTLNAVGLIEIIAVYCLQYVFEYGYKLQVETKGRIYSE